MNKRTKAMQISPIVKGIVFERDGGRCVLCGSYNGQPNAHYISRSQSGLGIEENILTLCWECHTKYDNSSKRKQIRETLKEYLKSKYEDWNEDNLVYKKG